MAVFKQRRGTSAALAAANETPAAGQIVIETDTNRLKVGDGVTPWNSLGYINNDIIIGDVAGLQAALDGKQASGSYANAVHYHTVDAITDLLPTLNAGYAPLVHVHTISATTGLQAALDGKAATVHTHTLSAITDVGTSASRDVPAVGNATSTQVVIGSDTRLSDQRVPTDGSVTAAKLSSSLKIDGGTV
jgi:hypothetical protein